MKWEYKKFGRWLRTARHMRLPTVSQERVAERIGSTQAKVSRWEKETPNTTPPTLDQCLHLADMFDVDFIKLATLCGRWNDTLERRILVSLSSKQSDLSQAPLAQVVALPIAAMLEDREKIAA